MSDNMPENTKHPHSGLTEAETDEIEATPREALAIVRAERVRSTLTIDAMLEAVAAAMERSSGTRTHFSVHREGPTWYAKASSNGTHRFTGSGETLHGAVRSLSGYVVADVTMRAAGLRIDADALLASVADLPR